MRRIQILTVTMLPALFVMLGGCGSSSPPPAAAAPAVQAATPEQASMAQADMMKVDPNARVGHVAAINPSMKMATVSGIPVNEIHVGDTLAFTDARQMPIANGTVRSIDTMTDAGYQFLIVDYQVSPNGRDPVRNDLAVFLPGAH